jgi:hypothetical protein
MRKMIICAAVLLFAASLAYGQSAGGGLSFFFPESLIRGSGSGSVSKESGLSTSVSFGEFISVPVGFTYIKASGLMAYEDTGEEAPGERLADRIWYVADTFIPYLRIQGSLGLGSVYLKAFGGLAGAWFVAPQAFDGAIGRHYGPGDSFYMFESLSTNFSFGYGYQYGGTVGVKIQSVSVGLEAVFTDLWSEAGISSDRNIFYDGSSTVQDKDFNESFFARLRGISLGITGSFEF